MRVLVMKFSDLVVSATTADATLESAKASLATATTDDTQAHSAVVAALVSKGSSVALVNPSGSISIYSVASGANDFTVQVIPGDYDVTV